MSGGADKGGAGIRASFTLRLLPGVGDGVFSIPVLAEELRLVLLARGLTLFIFLTFFGTP